MITTKKKVLVLLQIVWKRSCQNLSCGGCPLLTNKPHPTKKFTCIALKNMIDTGLRDTPHNKSNEITKTAEIFLKKYKPREIRPIVIEFLKEKVNPNEYSNYYYRFLKRNQAAR